MHHLKLRGFIPRITESTVLVVSLLFLKNFMSLRRGINESETSGIN
jgi:hypothetical protein